MSHVDHISKLPPEILGEILAHCTASDPDSPALLATISHRFHEVVSSTPRVWQRFNLSLSAHSEKACVRKIHLWFTRAAACILFLDVDLGSTTTSKDDLCTQVSANPMRHSLLPHILRPFSPRIGSLEVYALSEGDAQDFVSLVYPVERDETRHMALESLVVRINPDAPSANITPSTMPFCYSQLTLPKLSRLSCLRLVNHTLPDPSIIDLSTLRSLTIVRSIRAPPLHLQFILRILRTTPSLTRLEIEGRITDMAVMLSPEGDGEEEDKDPFALLTLPCLTHLSLRSNHIPQVLSALIMPELHTLRLDDLDGRRKNASEETATTLRQLLVRMDLPREKRKGNGLKVLDLSGVSIRRHRGSDGGVWDWCFRRLWFLEEIRARNLDVDELMDILVPPRHQNGGGGADSGPRGDIACPRLHSLSIVNNHPSRLVAKFRCLRPSVDLKHEIVDDPLNHSYSEFLDSLRTHSTSFPALIGSPGFGFGSSFDRRRLEGASKKIKEKH